MANQIPAASEPVYPGRTYATDSRIQWPSVVAGAFVALSLFVISVLLARAVDVDVTFRSAASRGGEAGAIIWGCIAALISFGIGAMIAGRNAAAQGSRAGWLNGLLVWAVAVPVLVYGLGSGMGPRLGQAAEPGGEMGAAVPAAAQLPSEAGQPVTSGSPGRVSHAQAAAWWTLLSLGLGLVAALAGGAMATKATDGDTGRPYLAHRTPVT